MLFLAGTALACGDGEPRMLAGPSPAIESTTEVSPPLAVPTTTPLPIPTILPPLAVPGWAVFHRGRDLWIGKLDGSYERALTRGALGSGFAGEAIDTAGNSTVYFTALTEQIGEEPIVEGGIAEVYRQPLDGSSDAERVTKIRVGGERAVLFRFGDRDAAVSPDGAHLAYADETGLWLRDLVTGFTRRLLTNRTCDEESPGLCQSFRWPSWSPDGEWLALARMHSRGVVADFIRPLEPVTEYTSEAGGSSRGWSPSGDQLCVSKGGSNTDGIGLMTARGRGFRDIGAELLHAGRIPAEARITTGCVWNADGRWAFSYWHDGRGHDRRIIVLSSDGSFLSSTRSALPNSGPVGWLPDGAGFVLVAGDGEGRPYSRILLLNGSLHELALATDDVVAVLPD